MHLNTSELSLVIFLSLLCILGTTLNGSILFVYRRTYARSTASLYYLTILALVNFLISIFVIPFTLLTDLGSSSSESSAMLYPKTARICGSSYFLRHFFTWISTLLLALIAYERYSVITAAKTARGLRLVERNLIMQSRKTLLLVILFSFCISVACFVLFEDENDDDDGIRKRNFQCDDIRIDLYVHVYHLTTVCIGLCVYVFIVVMYVKAYSIVHKSTKCVMAIKATKINVNQQPQLNLVKKHSPSSSSASSSLPSCKNQQSKKLFVSFLNFTEHLFSSFFV